MENPRSAIADRVKESNNVLVTVSTNPSVDQLAAAIGLTLVLNKLGKHATAVFSGAIPSTIEFLQPEKTIEKTTDSLRDFIISLDKSKADKLRYKVENKVVRIFITPFRTSISEDDLEFSQGDFNVDLVLALGVHRREDLDQVITAHGRILHDATVATINTQTNGELGSINWVETNASSLCEMSVGLSELIKTGLLDSQIATAFLTGIVAETNRFSNTKTTSETMAMSAKLMSAGANQQLVATKLEQQIPANPTVTKNQAAVDDGSLDINHDENQDKSGSPIDQIHIDEHGTLHLKDDSVPADEEPQQLDPPSATDSRPVMTSPPTLGGQLTASYQPEGVDPATDPLSLPSIDEPPPLLKHDHDPVAAEPPAEPATATLPEPSTILDLPDASPSSPGQQTSADIGLSSIDVAKATPPSAKPASADTPNLDAARDAVLQAVNNDPAQPLEPIVALNAQPVDLGQGRDATAPEPLPSIFTSKAANDDANVTSDPGLPPNLMFTPAEETSPLSSGSTHSLLPQDNGLPTDPTAASVNNPTAPPPVPPPMMPPPFGQPKADDDVPPQDPLAPL